MRGGWLFLNYNHVCVYVCLFQNLRSVSQFVSSLPSQQAEKKQAHVCVVWLHSDTSYPEVFSIQLTDFLIQCPLSHFCDNSHKPPTGLAH